MAGLKQSEAPFQLPLLPGLVAGLEKSRATSRWLTGSQFVCRAIRCRASKYVGFTPQAGAGKEAVLKAGAYHLLQIRIFQTVSLNRADVFMREVNSGNALIVS